MHSKSAVAVGTFARAAAGAVRSLPSTRHAATRTCGLRRMRLIFAECRSMRANSRVPSDTNRTGVATPVPSRLKLVTLRYRPGKSASRSAGRSAGRSFACAAAPFGLVGVAVVPVVAPFLRCDGVCPLVVRRQEQVRVVVVDDGA